MTLSVQIRSCSRGQAPLVTNRSPRGPDVRARIPTPRSHVFSVGIDVTRTAPRRCSRTDFRWSRVYRPAKVVIDIPDTPLSFNDSPHSQLAHDHVCTHLRSTRFRHCSSDDGAAPQRLLHVRKLAAIVRRCADDVGTAFAERSPESTSTQTPSLPSSTLRSPRPPRRR